MLSHEDHLVHARAHQDPRGARAPAHPRACSLRDRLSRGVSDAVLPPQAVKTLTGAQYEMRLARMVKKLPGGIFTLLHNANRRRQHGLN